MSNENKPRTLQDFLAAYDQDKVQSPQPLDLPAPKEVKAEEMFLLALYQEPEPQGLFSRAAQAVQTFWDNVLRPQNLHWVGAAALCGLLIGNGLLQQGQPGLLEHRPAAPAKRAQGPNQKKTIAQVKTKPQKKTIAQVKTVKSAKRKVLKKSPARPSTMHKKGISITGQDKEHALLFVGLLDGESKKFRRLGLNARCSKSQSLVFAFSLANQGGYAYFFRVRQGEDKPTLIYPFPGQKAAYWKGKSMHLIRRGPDVQKYQLQQEQGALDFILLQSSKPLAHSELQRILHSTKLPSISTSIDDSKSQQKVFFSRFTIQVNK